MNGKEKSRNIIKKFALATSALTTSACIFFAACGEAKSSEQPNPPPTVRSLETPTSEYETLLKTYYPELQEAGLQAREKTPINTSFPNGKPTIILNYTRHPINVNSAVATYGIFELIARNPQMQIKYPLGNVERTFILLPNDQVKSRITVLIPDNAPRPNRLLGGLGVGSESPGATYIDPAGNALSYAQPIVEKEDTLTNIFAQQVCYQTLITVVLDKDRKPIENLEETFLAQEIICNSLGAFISARLLGIPYDKYQEYIKRHSIGFPNIRYPIIPFAESIYSQFPTSGGILK